jgi:hypothetical protein
MRFVNTEKDITKNQTVVNFSDTTRFISSGLARGNTIECFSWIADYLFKQPDNTKINPHTCYISFFNDKEIMYEEFGNVQRLISNYSFFDNIIRQKFAPDTYELTRKQYSTISNKGGEFDLIEYLNISDQKKESYTSDNEIFNYNHDYWRAPIFIASGYRIHLDGSGKPDFDRYFWNYEWSIDSTVELKKAIVKIKPFGSDVPPAEYTDITSLISTAFTEESSFVKRIIDVKFNVADPKYFYFENLQEWICYYNDTLHYYEQSYSPYYGIVEFYDTATETPPINDWININPHKGISHRQSNRIMFFPNILRDGVLEPAKIISLWTGGNQSGKMSFNNGVHLGQPDDQSRIVYNICRHMINNFSDKFIISKKIDDYLYGGIDVDTERNRRYSSVVMTEPYFITEPICGGEIVAYSFVDSNNKPIVLSSSKENIFLKIKAQKNVINEIDNLLQIKEYNNDIIETLVINDPLLKTDSFCNPDEKYYTNFRDFFNRQDDCCDDLIGTDTFKGIIGEGHHVVFTIPEILPTTTTPEPVRYSKYSDGTKKINGFGFVSKTIIDTNGTIIGTKNFLNVYCSNYTPVNIISNVPVEFLSNPDFINNSYSNELFRPMIKLPGINGYIKIVEKNNHFKTTRSKDGKYEVVYNVEFPFCPGSYTERLNMNFTGDNQYKETVILKKLSYINAGSQELSEDKYNTANDRYVPFADDSFCPNSVLTQYAGSGSIITNTLKNGGGSTGVSDSVKNTISYPADMVWGVELYNSLSLIKPRISDLNYHDYRTYGTYDICFSYNGINFDRDAKFFNLVDNRQWKFAEDKYSSYINKENPAYICEINVATLFKNFTDYQSLNSALPDIKRWLYGLFSGFANMMLDADKSVNDMDTGNENTIVTEKINTIDNNDLSIDESKSDIIIEMWDNVLENWRPASITSHDSKKACGKLLLGGVHISHVSGDLTDGLLSYSGIEDVYTAAIGNIDDNYAFNFPSFINYGTSEDMIAGRSNLVLFNNLNNRTYHIIYIEPFSGSVPIARQLYRAYIYYNPAEEILPVIDIENFDIADKGPLSLYEPKKQLSKNTSFEIYTSEVIQGIIGNIITRYIDIKSTLYTDAEKYISDNKLYFRIRVVKNKNYSISYENKDESIIQYEGLGITSNTDAARLWMNFPWTSNNGVSFDTDFDWKKIKTREIVRKFGMSYFKCASK